MCGVKKTVACKIGYLERQWKWEPEWTPRKCSTEVEFGGRKWFEASGGGGVTKRTLITITSSEMS